MGLAKITITNIDDGTSINALFNPKEYTLAKTTKWTTYNNSGQDMPYLHFNMGQRRTLTMSLFFDTYNSDKRSVAQEVKKIESLMLIKNTLHRPPILLVSWGANALKFKSVLESLKQRYTMFLENGTPVRATIDVIFREIREKQGPPTPVQGEKQSPDHTKIKSFKAGDSLQSLSALEYDDPRLWKVLAEHNNIDDPLHIEAGKIIEIPPL
jgi:nucleoid-associated protein YgaU